MSAQVEVQLVVRRVVGNPSQMRFALLGRVAGGGSWTDDTRTGTIVLEMGITEVGTVGPALHWTVPVGVDLAARSGTGAEHYRTARRAGLEYGPAFALVERFTTERADGVLWSRTELKFSPDEDAGDAEGYVVHPALLDACFQAMIVMRPRIAGLVADDVYSPAALPELRNCGVAWKPMAAPGEPLVAEAVMRDRDLELGSMRFDLRLRTAAGEVLVEAIGMTVKRVESHATERAAEDVYVLGWKALNAPAQTSPTAAVGKHWLIFADAGAESAEGGTSSRAAGLARSHAERGGRCTLVWPGEVFRPLGDGERRLDLLGADEYELPLGDAKSVADSLDQLLGLVLAEAGQSGRISDVLDLWPIGAAADNRTLPALLQAQTEGVKFIPTLVQAITRMAWTHPPKLWLVTEGTQEVAEAPVAVRLAGSTVWGMAAVVIREHPELRPCVVDLGGDGDAEVDLLARLVLAGNAEGGSENRVAVRGERVFAQRLEPCLLKAKTPEARSLADGRAVPCGVGQARRVGSTAAAQSSTRGPVGADEVAIEIAYGALNFVDVTKVLGAVSGARSAGVVEAGRRVRRACGCGGQGCALVQGWRRGRGADAGVHAGGDGGFDRDCAGAVCTACSSGDVVGRGGSAAGGLSYGASLADRAGAVTQGGVGAGACGRGRRGTGCGADCACGWREGDCDGELAGETCVSAGVGRGACAELAVAGFC